MFLLRRTQDFKLNTDALLIFSQEKRDALLSRVLEERQACARVRAGLALLDLKTRVNGEGTFIVPIDVPPPLT
jgi:hypothetical protein